MTRLISKKTLFLTGLALFFFCYFITTLQGLQHAEINAFDYAIYQQALFDIASGVSLNPYNTIRDVHIFNEHFDPIVILVSPIVALFQYAHWSPFLIEWLFILTTSLSVLYLIRKEKPSVQILAQVFLLLPRFMLKGLLYPIHPVTWAVLPLLFMTYFLVKQRYMLAYLFACSLFIFKETFGFGFLGLSFYFLTVRQYRYFSLYFITASLMVIFEMKLRGPLMGEVISYGNSYAKMVFTEPFKTLKIMTQTFFSNAFLKGIAGYIIPFIFLVKERPFLKNKSLYAPLFYLFPLFLIHLIIERYSFHHASKFATLLSGILIFSGILTSLLSKRRLVLVTSLLLLILPSMSSIKKFFPFKQYSSDALADINIASKLVTENYKKGEKIYSTGGMAVRVLKPKMSLYHHNSSAKQEAYDYILLEKEDVGTPWPLTREKVEKIYERCAEHAQEVYLDTDHLYFAKGSFPKKCIYPRT